MIRNFLRDLLGAPPIDDTTGPGYIPIAKDGDLPTNADGGRIGVQSTKPVSDMTGSYYVCSGGILGKFAKQLDITMDDGNTQTGSMRVVDLAHVRGGGALATTAVVDSTSYIVCMGL